MKTTKSCLLCGCTAPADQATCVNDGEASWAPVVETPEPAEPPAAEEPAEPPAAEEPAKKRSRR